MSPGGVFVTGTDTGVGKTLIACAMAACYQHSGLNIGVMKPVATGGRLLRAPDGARIVSQDAVQLARSIAARDPWALINPVCFKEPMAPWAAAQRAGRVIRLGPVLSAYRRLRRAHDAIIVEGVGGLMVPLSRRMLVADLAVALGLPVVVVARAGLGTLNHTLMTVECLRRRRLAVAGIVLNDIGGDRGRSHADILRTNRTLLAALTGAPIVAEVPWLGRRTRHDNMVSEVQQSLRMFKLPQLGSS